MKAKKSKKTSQKPTPRTKSPQSPLMSEGLHEQIARRAYEVYEQRIRQGALDDWLQAEQEILGQERIWNADMMHRGGYAGEEQD